MVETVSKNENVSDTEVRETLYKPNFNDNSEKKLNDQGPGFNSDAENKEKTSLFMFCSSFTADLLIFVAGVGMSYTSPVIPKLQSSESPLNEPITTFQISLFVSMLGLGKLLGPFVYGKLADTFGRRLTLYAISAPMAVGMLILMFATDVRWYYVARFLLGAGAGAAFAIVATYNGEIAQRKNRGIIGVLGSLFASFGTLFPYAVGPHLNVKWFSFSCFAPLVSFYILAPIFAVESPLYATKVNDNKNALKSLKKLRPVDANIDKEFAELQEFVNETRDQDCGYMELFMSPTLRKPLIIGVGLAIFQQCTGIGAVVGFLQSIFNATGSRIPSHWASFTVGFSKMSVVFLTSALIENKGRRFLLITSGIGMGSSAFSVGLYTFLYSRNYAIAEYIWWAPLVALTVFVLSFNFGLGPVLWTLMGEIFPANIRATASATVTTTCFAVSGIVTFLFPIIHQHLGMETAFFVFSIFGFLSAIFSYIVVPETKGLTMSEIQDMWSVDKRDMWNIKRRMSEFAI